MKKLTLAVAVCLASSASADYSPTSIRWPAWVVSTSEDLFWGAKPGNYPIANMFDGDPKTAWVFRGLPPEKLPEHASRAAWWKGEYAISVSFTSDEHEYGIGTMLLDGIEIMNGYNKSKEIFERNNRIVEVAIYASAKDDDQDSYSPAKPLKVTKLSDKMGWHRISLPRKKYYEIKIVFTGIEKGPDDDICVSELRFLDRGRPIKTGFPRLHLATYGSDCG